MTKAVGVMLMVLLWCGIAQAVAEDAAFEVFKTGLRQEEVLRIFEARETFREAIRLAPDNVGYREHFAWFLHRYDFPEEAVTLFKALLSVAPDKGACWRGLGWNEWQLGRNAAALEAYRQVFLLPAAADDFRPALAEVKRLLGEEAQAQVSELRAKLTAQPADDTLRKQLLQAYLDAGLLPEALTLADTLLGERPDDLSLRLNRAQALSWSGRKGDAEAAMQGLVNDDPNNAYLLYELGRLQHAANRLPEAQANLERSLAFYGRAAVTRKELAEVLATMGQAEEATAMAEGIGGDPADTLTLLLARARSYHFSGRLDEANVVYQEILAAYPQNRDALWGLTESSVYTGNFAAAEHALERWQYAAAADDRYDLQRQRLATYTAPVLDARADYYGNSADFSRMNAGVDSRVYLGSGVTLIPAYAYSIFHQTGFSDIHRNTLSLNADYRPSRLFTASVGLGASLYDDDRQRLTSREALTVAPGHGFELGVAHEHLAIIDTEPPFRNPIYNYVVTLGAVGRKISSDDYTLNIVQRLRADLDAWGRFTYGDYSDGNRKLSWSLGMDYRPEPIHGLSLSYNYFYLDYADPAPVFTENTASVSAYYDPTNLEVHTLGVSYASAPTAPVRYGGQWNISYLPKSNGVANALFGFASLGLTKSQAIRLDVRYFYQDKGVGRTGTSGHFSAENVMLAYEYTF